MNIFTIIIYQPIFNAVLFFHKVLPGQDLGLAIILVTLLIKLLLYSPSLVAIRSSRQLQSLQPRLRELQTKYKNDREALGREQMKLYKESKVNPLAGCLPALIQIPFLYGLFLVFLNGLKVDGDGMIVADQVKNIYPALRDYYLNQPLNTHLFGLVDLAKNHNIILSLLAGLSQFWQSRMLAAPKEPKIPGARDEAMASALNKQMMYIFPVVTAYISYTLPAGLGLYWTASTIFTIGQQYLFLRRHPAVKPTAPALPNGSNA